MLHIRIRKARKGAVPNPPVKDSVIDAVIISALFGGKAAAPA